MNRKAILQAAVAVGLIGCAHKQPPPPPPAPATTADAPFRAKKPDVSGELKFAPPKPEAMKLKNGLTVYTIERHDLPIVDVELVVKTGRDADPADKQGLAAFTLDMLDEGTKEKGAPQIAASFEDLAIQYHVQGGLGFSSAGFNTLTQNLDAGLTVFADLVMHAAFNDKDVERVRGERQALLTAAHDDPGEVAADVLRRAIYGDKSPWGAPSVGTTEGIKAIKKSDLSKFRDSYYTPSNSALIVIGDVKAADLKPMLEKRFSGWKDKKAPAPKLADPKPAPQRQVIFIDKPGAPQSQIWAGQALFPAKDPDHEAMVLLNDVFGGMTSSRLSQDLRSEKGWSYGAYSFPVWSKGKGPWMVGGGFVADKTPESLTELTKLLDTLHGGEVTDAELGAARDTELRSLAGNFETCASTAQTLVTLVGEDLPIDYASTMVDKYQAVTAADLKRVAGRLDPSKMTLVVVGPKAEEQAKIEALNLGKLEQRDESGKLVK